MGRRAGRHRGGDLTPSGRLGSRPVFGSTRHGEWTTSYPDLAAALPNLDRVAASVAPCLIVGEPGTGRSSLARWIHHHSPRADGPWIEIDPGTVAASLFESELFGHLAGSFTGAQSAAPGRVARAEGGSFLLDHVEELPLALQPKLLRLLAEGRFRPVGGDERSCDVRFLAVGAEDLEGRVARGAFRRDLYFRLEVLALRIPPLRQRRRDMEGLIDSVLFDLGERLARPGLRLSRAAREWMVGYHWPGNLRQLRNVLERALILTSRGPLSPPRPADFDLDLDSDSARGPRPRTLIETEAREIRRALAYSRGHQGRAAKLLGISRKSLWERRRRHGIP